MGLQTEIIRETSKLTQYNFNSVVKISLKHHAHSNNMKRAHNSELQIIRYRHFHYWCNLLPGKYARKIGPDA